jgi:hypothetical protein
MTPTKGSFNIVIAGAWNPSIFNPNWLAKNILPQGEEAQIAYPINDISLPFQVSLPNVKLYPSTIRLEVKANNETLDGMDSVNSTSKKILDLLAHTPVNGIGFNYGFESKDDVTDITRKFDLQDSASIDSEIYILKRTVVQRTYDIEESRLNMTVSYDKDIVRLEFNYHYEINDTSEAIRIIESETSNDRLSKVKKFITDVYDIDVNECEEL